MVLFFITTLCVSIIGLSLLLGIKYWELQSGSMIFRGLRGHTHHFFRAVLLWIEHIIPTVVRLYSRWAWRTVCAYIVRGIARAVLYVETLLEQTLHKLRHSTDVKRGMGEASAFLREVAEHKKKLLRAEGRAPAHVRIRASRE